MTDLATRKTKLRFATSATIKGRQLVIEAEPHIVRIREKGLRHSYEISWEAIYWLAIKKAVRP